MTTEAVVELNGLTKYFGNEAAVHNVSFAVQPGEVFALLGPNGAGKTTMIQMLMGFLEPTRGQASLFGCPCGHLTPAVRARIGYLAEGHTLYGWMKVRELVRFSARTHSRWDDARFRTFLDYFSLDEDKRIRTLSNGQRACLSLSLTLACGPELLVMDDPTIGMDASVRQEFLRGIVDLVAREERTVIFSSHILTDVERVADRVGIIMNGELRTDVSLEEFKSSVVRYHLHFGGNAPADLQVPRMVSMRVVDQEMMVTVVRPDADVESALAASNPVSCDQESLSLEDAFVDYIAGGRKRLVFA